MSPETSKHGICVAVVGPNPNPDKVELFRVDRADGCAVLSVVAGGEHLSGVDGERDAAACRPCSRSLQVFCGRFEDEQRLDQQRQVRGAITVHVRLPDRLGFSRADESADEESGHVQPLPRRQVVANDNCRFRRKVGDRHRQSGSTGYRATIAVAALGRHVQATIAVT